MEVYRRSSWLLLFVQLSCIALKGINGELNVQEGPSESECRPYIEKALKQLETSDTVLSSQGDSDCEEDIPTVEITTNDSYESTVDEENEDDNNTKDGNESNEAVKQDESHEDSNEKQDDDKEEDIEKNTENENDDEAEEPAASDGSVNQDDDSKEDMEENNEDEDDDEPEEQETSDESGEQPLTVEQIFATESELLEGTGNVLHDNEDEVTKNLVDVEKTLEESEGKITEGDVESNTVTVDDANSKEDNTIIQEEAVIIDNSKETNGNDTNSFEEQSAENIENAKNEVNVIIEEISSSLVVDSNTNTFNEVDVNSGETNTGNNQSGNKDKQENDSKKVVEEFYRQDLPLVETDSDIINADVDTSPVEDLIEEINENLLNLRPRDHINQLLKLDDEESHVKVIERTSDIILRDLKRLYDTAIKPLETLYKYKDLSNRHYGDSEIFSKPLILFMGPWSGGKSSIINYLLGIEYTEHRLHTGAEPSPAYFNILMYGQEPEILDGIQLAADYTFSGLQKFGQGLEERLRGYKLPSKLLEKVNIVEIPGILEVRKQVSRVFPFNDACQWFIDRSDIIFLVYDPSKLDVGPETEAILDQLKGREHQTRIILNKADQVKPEELLRVQGALIWNISPLMSSAQPPILYTTSLWSKPYEPWAPVRLLQAQERSFLRDIRSAVDKRIDNKIASARRFAVRVRNHAKMVDCYLTTYYNHKSVFGNRKHISDEIINHPQDFHIYEGLSTLTNISRYDLPDPDVYRDFFRLNALYDFQQLSATCTYFRGCPINRLDIAIAYDLPELVGKHRKLVETANNEGAKTPTPKS